jgi:GAF domain-containing protein
VTAAPWIRFYAGAPLTMANGQRVGTLCLIDSHPKRLDDWERAHLVALSKLIAAELQGMAAPQSFAEIRAQAPAARPAEA